jgi:DNA replication protein DnaC
MGEMGLATALESRLSAIRSLPVSTADRAAAEADEQAKRRQTAWAQVISRIGERYKTATFDSFERTTPKQVESWQAVKGLAEGFADAMRRREGGLLIAGPRGTGKDHLAVAALRVVALDHGVSVEWVDGESLWQQQRDGIDSGAREADLVARYATPTVLLISDPVRVSAPLTDAQRSLLWRIVDRRYRDLRPTWVTANVVNEAELGERVSPQISDRMRDGAVCVFCNWASHRAKAGS